MTQYMDFSPGYVDSWRGEGLVDDVEFYSTFFYFYKGLAVRRII